MWEVVFTLLVVAAYIGVAIYMILNPEVVGDMRGWVGHGSLTMSTPGCLIRAAGCVMLALLPGGLAGALTGLWWVGVLVGLAAAVGIYIGAGRWWPLDESWGD